MHELSRIEALAFVSGMGSKRSCLELELHSEPLLSSVHYDPASPHDSELQLLQPHLLLSLSSIDEAELKFTPVS